MKSLCRAVTIAVVLLAVTSCLIIPPSPVVDAHEPTDDEELSAPEGAATTAVVEPGGTPAADVRDAESVPGDGSPGHLQIPARVLAAGSQSAVRTPATVSVASQAVLEEVWFAIHANQITPPAIPEVDFTSETVIIVILGERRSAGYSVRAAGVTRGERAVEVSIEVFSPSPDLMTASVLTSPFEISAISVTDTPVTFVGDDVRDGFDAE